MIELPHDDLPDEQAVEALAAHLDAYAVNLSAREREALMIILVRAMDPVERMRWCDATTLLSPSEEEVLRLLLNKEVQG